MDLSLLKYKRSKTRYSELIEFHSVDEIQWPYKAKNGFDNNIPFMFIQHKKYIEIWNVGYYTDYPLTWARGLAHFAYTINELYHDNPLETIEINNNNNQVLIHNLKQFQNEWLNKHKEYNGIIEELIEVGLYEE